MTWAITVGWSVVQPGPLLAPKSQFRSPRLASTVSVRRFSKGRRMTLARKGTRAISVDGVGFRWKIRGRPTYCQGLGWVPLTFVAESANGQGSLLVVELPVAHPGNWLDLPTASVTPSLVASSIRSAVDTGWLPEQPGPVLRVKAKLPTE